MPESLLVRAMAVCVCRSATGGQKEDEEEDEEGTKGR